jgi:hypothetical protein
VKARKGPCGENPAGGVNVGGGVMVDKTMREAVGLAWVPARVGEIVGELLVIDRGVGLAVAQELINMTKQAISTNRFNIIISS